jgi:hypothetical protein
MQKALRDGGVVAPPEGIGTADEGLDGIGSRPRVWSYGEFVARPIDAVATWMHDPVRGAAATALRI